MAATIRSHGQDVKVEWASGTVRKISHRTSNLMKSGIFCLSLIMDEPFQERLFHSYTFEFFKSQWEPVAALNLQKGDHVRVALNEASVPVLVERV